MYSRKKYFILLLLPFSLLLTFLARLSPSFTDKYYSRGVYRGFTEVFGRITSFLPFSIAEVLIFSLLIGIPILIIRFVVRLIKSKGKRKQILANTMGNIAISLSVVYFVFTIFAGLNYHRSSFKEVIGLEVGDFSQEELEEMTFWLIDTANSTKEESLALPKAERFSDLAKEARQEYIRFGTKENRLGGFTPVPKGVFASRFMSYTDITGVFTFFTLECNLNTDVPDFSLHYTTLHELAHFKGYMNETEANFIAFLVGDSSANPHISYSAYYSALSYTLNAYYRVATSEEYSAIVARISPLVLKDFSLNSEYWKQFETPIAEIGTKVNDTYLKAQGQSSGVKSYGEMVDLLLAYYTQYVVGATTKY